ncbi:aminoglycoside 6-adenylyltransferase [Oceanobacillus kapialis]|uniref:Aminoglycoside 6-adenylyltransferase n=1 Tax=Oceanobacillus kapialis TaxID=481353 RepID=A0ABW5Q1S4_9BACI
MRNEQEMMDLILHKAESDERIRAVYMNGSRTNPNVLKDIFQDYDIVYVVTELAPFIKERAWIADFGKLLMMQEPDKNNFGKEIDSEILHSYGLLMLFTDGNRIDLQLKTKAKMLEEYELDKLTIPLLDKDNILPQISEPTDEDYHLQQPTKEAYDSYTNNFWWCLQNVAKGIWRDELPYAKQMFELTMRDALDVMVSWWIGIQTDFQVSTGKLGKYFKKYLPASYWKLYEETYSNANYENMWDSIVVTCELFRVLAKDVAVHFRFTYPVEDDRNMMAYLAQVRNLSADAEGVF